jgi:ribonuclease VapC
MVVDTSALIAILKNEPERDRFIEAIGEADERLMSAFNLFEARTVLFRRGGTSMLGELAALVRRSGIEFWPFDVAQAGHAFRAYQRFGKGSGHPAQLNLGDCAAYALATSQGLPLLFKGNDFPHTDVRPALA